MYLPHFLFIITKRMYLAFAAKGRPRRTMGEMKEGNFLFSSYSILKYAPCISPISFSLSYKLQMKGMNLRFAAIWPRQMGEMEEIGEIVGECYGGSFY